jgi:hypothetical protein
MARVGVCSRYDVGHALDRTPEAVCIVAEMMALAQSIRLLMNKLSGSGLYSLKGWRSRYPAER